MRKLSQPGPKLNRSPARPPKKGAIAEKLAPVPIRIPRDRDAVEVRLGSKTVRLTHLRKIFWTDLGTTKGDLIQFLRWRPDKSPNACVLSQVKRSDRPHPTSHAKRARAASRFLARFNV